jgi:hypothetical protein
MPRVKIAPAALLASLTSATAFAQSAEVRTDVSASQPAPSVSSELLDPEVVSRFHLVTRVTFGDGSSPFSSSSIWSYEARGHLRILDWLAAEAVIPIGFYNPEGDTSSGFIGNVSAGASAGFPLALGSSELRVGAGLDFYLPTARTGDREVALGEAFGAAIRSYEPQLYIPSLFSVRARGTAQIEFDKLQLAVELGLIPAVTTRGDSDFLFLVSAAARASYDATPMIAPFLELGAARQIAGPGEIAPPFLVTPGVRFHVAELFDPAIFLSFNFVEPSAFLIGVDLATIARHTASESEENELGDPGDLGKKKKSDDEGDEFDQFLDF